MAIRQFAARAAALFGLAAAPQGALAQSAGDIAGMFATPSGDPYTALLLNQLFGPLFPPPSGESAATVFSALIGHFNVIFLVVGGALFFYNVSVGILQSAHEGQVLGRRWSSLWAPLRLLVAVGMLAPLPNLGGYNLAQAGVAYLVKGSTNVATAVWRRSAEMILADGIPVAAGPSRFDTGLIRALHANAACLQVVNYQAAIVGAGRRVQYGAPVRVAGGDGPFDGGAGEGFVSVTAVVGDGRRGRGLCGFWRTPDIPLYIRRVIDENGAASDAAKRILARFADGHRAIVQHVAGELEAITAGRGNPGAPVREDVFRGDVEPERVTGAIRGIALEANRRLADLNGELRAIAMSADGHGSLRESLLERIAGGAPCAAGAAEACHGEGWLGAGAYYATIARANNELASLTDANAVAGAPRYGVVLGRPFSGGYVQWRLDGALGEAGPVARLFGAASGLPSGAEARRLLARYEESFNASVRSLAALGFHMTPAEIAEANQTVGAAPQGIAGKAIAGLKGHIVQTQAAVFGNLSPAAFSDPMAGLIEMGGALISLGSAALLLAGLSAPVAIAALPFFTLLFAAGVTLSFVLPLLPFFYWILAVTGYFLLVVEAIFAVNLWAMAHLRMEGDGLSGPAGQKGWLMLLALALAPVLMVFGLLAGMALFRVTSTLISAGMLHATAGIAGTANLYVSLVSLVGFGAMISVVYVVVAERSFSLISEFPNRVMAWMGERIEVGGGAERARAGAHGGAAAAHAVGGRIHAAGDAVRDRLAAIWRDRSEEGRPAPKAGADGGRSDHRRRQ